MPERMISALLKSSAVTKPPSGLLQRKCACGAHTPGGSECAECDKKKPDLQRKLSIGASTDPLELEADRVAEQVVSMSAASESMHASLRKQSVTSHPAHLDAPLIVDEVLQSPGSPLDRATRAYMEPRFGYDFSHIRLHTDAHAAKSARAVNAVAYTIGHHLTFDTGSYAPQTPKGRRLLAHELVHTLQQSIEGRSPLGPFDESDTRQGAHAICGAASSQGAIPVLHSLSGDSIARQEHSPDEPLTIERNFELDPHMFLRPMESRAEREVEKCEEFPGGSTNCEVDLKTGTPTGKVTNQVDETNPCTRPCVVRHEAIHVKQLRKFCPELRDCYLAADKGKRPATDCAKMVIYGGKQRECEAYKISVPCVEERVKNARECQSKTNKDYGARKLVSEKCFRDKNCGS